MLDFCGPFEVFSVTRLDEARRREEPSPFQVVVGYFGEAVGRATVRHMEYPYPDDNRRRV